MSVTFTDMGTGARGRPVGLLLNHEALRHLLDGRPQSWLAREAEMSTAHLSEMVAGGKGATRDVADKIAAALKVNPAVLFPQLVEFTTTVRHFTAPKVEEAA